MSITRLFRNPYGIHMLRRYSEFTHFGNEQVRQSEKQGRVNNVFSSVADKYDLMNDLMSAGIHRLWKECFVKESFKSFSFLPGTTNRELNFIDVAGGTGDIAFKIVEHIKSSISHFSSTPINISVVDINPSMLEVGRKRAIEQQGYEEAEGKLQVPKTPVSVPNITMDFSENNAESLAEVPSNSFDVYTIAFGIRNCTNIDRVLSEAYRVLRPGGRFCCLELSHVENPVLSKIYDFYSFSVIPEIGRLFANDRDSYAYLVESIRKFPKQDEFKGMIESAGFKHVTYDNYSFGVASMHSGYKLK